MSENGLTPAAMDHFLNPRNVGDIALFISLRLVVILVGIQEILFGPPCLGPDGAGDSSRWEASTAGRGAPTGRSAKSVPRPSGAHDESFPQRLTRPAGAHRRRCRTFWARLVLPTNVGDIADADGVGEVGAVSCGDVMRSSIKVPAARSHCPVHAEEVVKAAVEDYLKRWK